MKNKIKILSLAAILIIIGLIVFSFLWKKEDTYNKNISDQEKSFNESGRAKAIEKETDLWMVYEDKDGGFSIKYPGDVAFGGNDDTVITLSVESRKIDTLADTMGYNKETALKNIESLKKGEYGENVDWPLDESKKVVKIGDVNAQEFAVLSRFEVCSVVFERKLYFFNNDHQIVITLKGPKNDIINNSSDYFKIDKENCGTEKVWNFDKQKEFFSNLKNSNGSEVAVNWFKLFDEIKETIEIAKKQSSQLSLLLGRWISLDDANSEIEFKEGKKIDYYQKKKLSEGTFVQEGKSLIVNEDGDEFKYTILELSDTNLSLSYLARGNTLNYKRVSGN
ncbi:MAG: hypothetical protein WCX30_01590 [Candidatus Paceibacterota bacterium]|jgi:hypothetical protein|nr:hypothetical protein [bacterium]